MPFRLKVLGVSLALAMGCSSDALSQSMHRAVFVANNGNLEGSVTAYRIGDKGVPIFVNRIVTGTRASTNDPCAGCNAYEIALSPDGVHLATAHAAGAVDGLTIFKVGPDASIEQLLQVPFGFPNQPGTPMDLVWVTNELIAFLRTDTSPDQIVIARFNPNTITFTELTWNQVLTTNSVTYLAVHPTLPIVYANDSAQRVVRAYTVNPLHFSLELIDTESTGLPFPLELAISSDGTKMYAAGGISDGGNKIIGLNVASDGTLSLMPESPFISPGASPSNVWINHDSSYVIAGHGADATARTFAINPVTGALSSTGHMFDVGLQGTLGDVRTLGDLLFVTDNSTAIDGLMGIYSFTMGPGGSLTQNGPILSTQGIAPRSLATWKPPAPFCPNDINNDGQIGVPDLLAVIGSWGPCAKPCPPACPADLVHDCNVGVPDLLAVISSWGPCK